MPRIDVSVIDFKGRTALAIANKQRKMFPDKSYDSLIKLLEKARKK